MLPVPTQPFHQVQGPRSIPPLVPERSFQMSCLKPAPRRPPPRLRAGTPDPRPVAPSLVLTMEQPRGRMRPSPVPFPTPAGLAVPCLATAIASRVTARDQLERTIPPAVRRGLCAPSVCILRCRLPCNPHPRDRLRDQPRRSPLPCSLRQRHLHRGRARGPCRSSRECEPC